MKMISVDKFARLEERVKALEDAKKLSVSKDAPTPIKKLGKNKRR